MMGSAHVPTHCTVFSVSSPNTIITVTVKEIKIKTLSSFIHPHVDPIPKCTLMSRDWFFITKANISHVF